MTNKTSNVVVDVLPTELLFFKIKFNKALDERIRLGEELYYRQVYTKDDIKNNRDDFYTWSNYNSEYLKKAFNKEQNEYKKNYDEADSFFFGTIGLRSTPLENLKTLKDKINFKITILKKIRANTESIKCQLPVKSIRMAI